MRLLQRCLRVGYDRGVALGFAKLDQANMILDVLPDAAERLEAVLQRGALLHQAAGALGIIPQVGVFSEVVELGEAGARVVDVKDASSAVRATA